MDKLKAIYKRLLLVIDKIKAIYEKVFLLSQPLILHPLNFWRDHQYSNETTEEILKDCIYPLLALAALGVFLGDYFRSDYFTIGSALLWSMREVALFALLWYGGIFASKKWFAHLGYQIETKIIEKLIAYALIPFLVVSTVTGLFPFLDFFDLLGFYSFYIFWAGARKMLPFPKEKRDSYILVLMSVVWTVFVIVSYVLAKLLTPSEA